MASDRDIFSLSGPLHLTAIDWRNSYHRTSVAASLVQGTYILERDRQEHRQGTHALAPPWWEFFHFQLIIAFRGTILKASSLSNDLKLDLQFIGNRLHKSRRFQIAMQAVHEMISLAGAANVWLAGHSIGAAIALLTGKNMVKMGCPVEAYLFNPPFTSAQIDKIKNEKVKHGVQIASSVIKAGITTAVSSKSQMVQREDWFQVLSRWIPYIYVNPSDPICSEYIGYFEHREKMAEVGAGGIGRVATQHSIGSLVSSALGKDIEPTHLLPSAFLTISMNSCRDFKECHGLHQWWRRDFQWRFKLHQFS